MISFPCGSVLIFLCFGLIGTLMIDDGGAGNDDESFSAFFSTFVDSLKMFSSYNIWKLVTHWRFVWSSFDQTNIIKGPVFYFPFYEASFGSVSGSLVLQGTQSIPFFHLWLLNSRSGFGSSALLVASFGSAQIAAIEAGFPESMEVQQTPTQILN